MQPHENGRTKISYEISLSPDETREMETKKCARHIDSPKPVPCQLYQSADPNLRVVKGSPDFNGTAVKAYVLAGARSVALSRCMPGKTLLRLMFPGKTDLGFATPADAASFSKWWQASETHIKTQLTALLFETVAGPATPVPMAVVESRSEAKLNPLDPSEAGVRRRALEDF